MAVKKAGRPKVDKKSLEYLIKNYLDKKFLFGFQITIGLCNNIACVSLSENKQWSGCMDFSKIDIENIIGEKIFKCFNLSFNRASGVTISDKQIEILSNCFKDLGHEVESSTHSLENLGSWLWLRVKCAPEEFENKIKEIEQYFANQQLHLEKE